MPNPYNTKQVANLKPGTKGQGVKPLPSGPKDQAMLERTANWPSLPGKSGPERSAGVNKAKVYPKAQGI